MKSKTSAIFFALLFLTGASLAHATTYEIDTAHSSVGFKIRHLFSNTRGSFEKFKGTVDFEAGKPETWKAEAEIETASINTNVPDRDKHLRGSDFFEVEKYPTMTFKTTKVLESTDKSAKLEGVLSLHGVEKPVTLNVDILGAGSDPWGNERAGFTATTTINRKDFGIIYNKALDNGGMMLGDEVEVIIEIEAVHKKPEAPAA